MATVPRWLHILQHFSDMTKDAGSISLWTCCLCFVPSFIFKNGIKIKFLSPIKKLHNYWNNILLFTYFKWHLKNKQKNFCSLSFYFIFTMESELATLCGKHSAPVTLSCNKLISSIFRWRNWHPQWEPIYQKQNILITFTHC